MATDIVIQLRGLASSMKRGEGMSTVYGAAKEIERLRELADNFYKTLLYYECLCGISPCKCGYDDMMDEYKEVRGE